MAIGKPPISGLSEKDAFSLSVHEGLRFALEALRMEEVDAAIAEAMPEISHEDRRKAAKEAIQTRIRQWVYEMLVRIAATTPDITKEDLTQCAFLLTKLRQSLDEPKALDAVSGIASRFYSHNRTGDLDHLGRISRGFFFETINRDLSLEEGERSLFQTYPAEAEVAGVIKTPVTLSRETEGKWDRNRLVVEGAIGAVYPGYAAKFPSDVRIEFSNKLVFRKEDLPRPNDRGILFVPLKDRGTNTIHWQAVADRKNLITENLSLVSEMEGALNQQSSKISNEITVPDAVIIEPREAGNREIPRVKGVVEVKCWESYELDLYLDKLDADPSLSPADVFVTAEELNDKRQELGLDPQEYLVDPVQGEAGINLKINLAGEVNFIREVARIEGATIAKGEMQRVLRLPEGITKEQIIRLQQIFSSRREEVVVQKVLGLTTEAIEVIALRYLQSLELAESLAGHYASERDRIVEKDLEKGRWRLRDLLLARAVALGIGDLWQFCELARGADAKFFEEYVPELNITNAMSDYGRNFLAKTFSDDPRATELMALTQGNSTARQLEVLFSDVEAYVGLVQEKLASREASEVLESLKHR